MIKLYNTLTHKKEIFRPIKKGKVGIYSCGPTVYNYAHLGNLRSFIFADILRRTLEYNGYEVRQVMNITDVGHLVSDADSGEDKMKKGARREKKIVWEIARFYTQAFKKDISRLNIKPASFYPKATGHIKEQIELIKKIEKNGFTYKTSHGLYFDSSCLKDYGKLSQLVGKNLKGGARVELSREKKNITDFALWKFSSAASKREMVWDSPWGKGFPGWHIECSAMSLKYLGLPFDIHTGGIDHIPVHHTNEIAQTEAAYGVLPAHYWLHGEFLVVGKKDKMAKSGENFITLNKIIEKGLNPLAYRYFVLGTHYHHPLRFSYEAIRAAQNALDNLYQIISQYEKPNIGCAEYEEKFKKALNNDLDTPRALALLWQLVKDKELPPSAKRQTLLKFDQVFGLGFSKIKKKKVVIPQEIKKLASLRDEARGNQDWQKADELRKKIEGRGFYLEDTKEGSLIKTEDH